MAGILAEIGAANGARDVGREPRIDAGRVEHVVAMWDQAQSIVVGELSEAHGTFEWSLCFADSEVLDGGVEEGGEGFEGFGVDATLGTGTGQLCVVALLSEV